MSLRRRSRAAERPPPDVHPNDPDTHVSVKSRKGDEELTRGLQAYNPAILNNSPCQDLEIIDACRATSVEGNFTGKFVPYPGSCEGDFTDDLSIYYNAEKNFYMYALDRYPDDWSNEAIQGLVRWRIASFDDSGDKPTCRHDEANPYQFEFAADGQPYNYFPAVYCYDENGNGSSWPQASTITILCYDIVVQAAADKESNERGGWSAMTISFSVAGNILLLMILLGVCYWVRRLRQSGNPKETKEEVDPEKNVVAVLDEGETPSIEVRTMQTENVETLKEIKPIPPHKKNGAATLSQTTSDSTRTTPIDSDEVDTSGEEQLGNRSRTSLECMNKKQVGEEESSAVPLEILSMVAKLDKYFDANDSGSEVYFDANESGLDIAPSKKKSKSKSSKRKSRSGKRHSKRGRSRPVDHQDDNQYPSPSASAGNGAKNTLRSYSTGPLPKSRSLSRKGGVKDDYRNARSVNPGGGDNMYRSRSLSRSTNKDHSPASRISTSRRHESNGFSLHSGKDGYPACPDSVPRTRSLSRSTNKDDKPVFLVSIDHRDGGHHLNLNSGAVLPGVEILAGPMAVAPESVPRSRSLGRTTHKNYNRAPRGKSPYTEDGVKMAAQQDNNRLRSSSDNPKGNYTVEKQPDGSVLVLQRRTRDDGAVVTTKTKYANSALAKKHGIDLNIM